MSNTKTLKSGSKGEDVAELQHNLEVLGYKVGEADGHVALVGFYGPGGQVDTLPFDDGGDIRYRHTQLPQRRGVQGNADLAFGKSLDLNQGHAVNGGQAGLQVFGIDLEVRLGHGAADRERYHLVGPVEFAHRGRLGQIGKVVYALDLGFDLGDKAFQVAAFPFS